MLIDNVTYVAYKYTALIRNTVVIGKASYKTYPVHTHRRELERWRMSVWIRYLSSRWLPCWRSLDPTRCPQKMTVRKDPVYVNTVALRDLIQKWAIAIITILVHVTQFLALINVTRLCHKKIPKLIIKNECPLQQVECDLSWAGCTVTTQRKDIEVHIASDPAHHIAILAI